jgi:hypothetical protein
MSIDTLEFVKALESAGVERKVAEAHVKVLAGARDPCRHRSVGAENRSGGAAHGGDRVGGRHRHHGRGAGYCQLTDPVPALIQRSPLALKPTIVRDTER